MNSSADPLYLSTTCESREATNPEAAQRARLLELAEGQGWPQFVQFQHPSGRLAGLHNGRERHWREWVEQVESAVLTAVVEALELGETSI